MKSSTAFHHYFRLEHRQDDAFGATRCYRPTFESYLAGLKPFDAELGALRAKGFPRYYVAMLGARESLYFHRIQQELTLYVYEFKGVCYQWNDLPMTEKGEAVETDKIRSGSIWFDWAHEKFPRKGIPVAQVKLWSLLRTNSESHAETERRLKARLSPSV